MARDNTKPKKTYISPKPGANKKELDRINKSASLTSVAKSNKSKTIKKTKVSNPPKLASKGTKKTEAKEKNAKALDKIKQINKKPNTKKAKVVSGEQASKLRAESALTDKVNKKKNEDKLAPAKLKEKKVQDKQKNNFKKVVAQAKLGVRTGNMSSKQAAKQVKLAKSALEAKKANA